MAKAYRTIYFPTGIYKKLEILTAEMGCKSNSETIRVMIQEKFKTLLKQD